MRVVANKLTIAKPYLLCKNKVYLNRGHVTKFAENKDVNWNIIPGDQGEGEESEILLKVERGFVLEIYYYANNGI